MSCTKEKYTNDNRSAFLLIEAGNINGLSKAALGAVALETITDIICEKKFIVEEKNHQFN